MAMQVQNLKKSVDISHSTNTFGKSMNPIILPSTMAKKWDWLGSLALVR